MRCKASTPRPGPCHGSGKANGARKRSDRGARSARRAARARVRERDAERDAKRDAALRLARSDAEKWRHAAQDLVEAGTTLMNLREQQSTALLEALEAENARSTAAAALLRHDLEHALVEIDALRIRLGVAEEALQAWDAWAHKRVVGPTTAGS